ncbi:ABC transporter substrate-binding protein [Bacillus sp. SD088]|uniref:ABC transporter substrate-binding protein n=1 Tax=Bacillus sp. SD088 TaxID=2782012 RepID=UPI001A96C344|nr:extracellular solute-binding protein [Bacillus sp. SD088]MBO0991695.1 extracellular solute-binding protein [Bacillus sp. SD088]
MRKSWCIIILFIVSVTMFVGCSINSNPQKTDSEEGNGETDRNIGKLFEISPDIEGEINFWTWTPDIYEKVVEAFNKDYPDIKVNVIEVEFGELHDKLQTTLAAGKGSPDVSQVEQGQFARYSTGDLLEDLLQAPYDAGQYQELVSDYNWERWKSVDGKRLVGMPWDITPGIFYYREDIYEQMGLPSDPEELGEYLRDKDNLLNAAQTLAANDIYMYDWQDLPAVQYGDSIGYFDSDYNWVRNNDKMVELFDIVKQGIQIGWAPQLSGLFSDEGKQLMKQGKIASIAMGSFGARDLEAILPEQAGKWRAARMPLDVNVGLGGSSFVIPSQGENKDASWAFVEWITLSEESWKEFVEHSVQPSFSHIISLPWYQEHTNEFLGDQEDYKLYSSIDENIPVRRLTPLDGAAWGHYIDGLNESIENNIDSKTSLDQIEENAMKELASEIDKLKEEMEKAE